MRFCGLLGLRFGILSKLSPASYHSVTSQMGYRCPGYLREEITLTADVSRSVVVAHQYPSQSEICTICGQLVQYFSNPVPLVADDPSIHLTPSTEEPNAVHGFESSGLFNPLLKYDVDWNIPTPETQTISSGAPSGHANANPEDHDGEVEDNGKAKS